MFVKLGALIILLLVAHPAAAIIALLAYAAMRETARRVTVDDTSTVFGASKLGVVCKLAYILDIPTPQIEKVRFVFYSAARSKEDEDCYTDEFQQASSTSLVVAFSGGATNKISMPRLEFRHVLNRSGQSACRVFHR